MVAKQVGKREAQVQVIKQESKSGNLGIRRAMKTLIQRFRRGVEELAEAQEPEAEVPISRRKTRASPGKRTLTLTYLRTKDVADSERVKKTPSPQQIRGIPVRPQIMDTASH